ncbi:MAG: Sec-independent protein translocase protein TatB [Qipengyuania sp.]
MFDIGAAELLLIVVVAILVIGPKEMPRALRHAGRWIGKIRRMSSHFRSGMDAMIREAEMEEAESEWKARNARIMAEHPEADGDGGAPQNLLPEAQMEPLDGPPPSPDNASVRAEAAIERAKPGKPRSTRDHPETPEGKGDDV